MESFVDFIVQFGGPGMFIAALVAGSVVPFSSELVLTALQVAGVSNLSLLLWGTAGNVAGGCVNYGLGRLGKIEWIERYAHTSPEKLERAESLSRKYGPVLAVLAWIPILGSAITIALGLLRANFPLTVLFMTIGKAARYALIIYTLAWIE